MTCLTTAQLVKWLVEQLERTDLPAAERKVLTNRLKVTRKRPVIRNTGHYTNLEWAYVKKRRKQAAAAKRRNRHG